MNLNHLLTTIALLLAFVVYSDAVCCGRGSKGFCKDCSAVRGIFSKGQKCCGSGSGKGHGCNVFCCNCNSCRTGTPKITYLYGWWLKSKYTCKKLYGDNDQVTDASEDISNTKAIFTALDADNDNTLSPEEFAEGLRQHMNVDFESSYSLAADLLNSRDQENVIPLMDAAQNQESLEGAQEADMMRLIRKKFISMDANNDGLIQAAEFDKDL